MPKELLRKSIIQAHENAREITERKPPEGDTPEQYAENRFEHTADNAVHHAGQKAHQRGKQLVKKKREAYKQKRGFDRGTEPRSSFSSESNAYRTGKKRVRYNAKSARRTAQNAKYSNHATYAGKGAVKTTKKTVKAAQHSMRASKNAVKTAEYTAKTTRKATQATAKITQRVFQAAKATAKTTMQTVKVTAKATTAMVRAIITGVKALITAIAAGGWVAVIIILIVAVIALIFGSAFGIFFSNDAGDGIPISQAVTGINADFQAKIDSKIESLSSDGSYDEIEVIYEGDLDGDSSTVNNWMDVLTVFAVKYMGENGEVITITQDKVDELKNIFNEMNELSVRTETASKKTTTMDDDGEEKTVTYTILIIYIKVNSLTYEEGAEAYGFTSEQIEIADEMMSPDYYALYAELLGVDLLGGANLTEIISNLPVGTEGAEVVKIALTKIGAPYVSGAKGDQKFDCSGLVYWAINEADPELGSIMYTNAAGQAKWCIENGKAVGRSELQLGDLVFWQNLTCPGCGRWNEIHHVGIYIGDGKVIEASSSKGHVVVRDLWSSASYPIYAFVRPYV